MSQVLHAIARHAFQQPDAVALSDRNVAYTYGALQDEVEAAVGTLAAFACLVRPGAPAAVAVGNGPAWVVLDLALIRLGWPSLPLPGFFTPEQSAHAMADAGAGLLISDRPGSGAVVTIAGQRLRVEVLNNPAATLPAGTAKITYTSGSTGRPKGVCLSQAHMEATAQSLVQAIGAEYAGRHLPILPLAVLLENVAGLHATLLAGGRYHALSADELGLGAPFAPDILGLVAAIDREEAQSLILVPELLRAILMALSFTGARLPKLKLVAVGGAKVSPRLLGQADALGLPVCEGYGLSECASVVALNTPAERKAGAVGRPLAHLQVEIDGDGEIIVGPEGFLGYAGGGVHRGPVRTGDLGRLDAEGFLHVDGRADNTIITAYGRNVAPEWVESELLGQPEIRQAVVFGEARAGLCALIAPLHPDVSEAAIAEAVARANSALPDYAQVRRWRVRGPFDPAAGELTGNGRPRRAALLANERQFIDAED